MQIHIIRTQKICITNFLFKIHPGAIQFIVIILDKLNKFIKNVLYKNQNKTIFMRFCLKIIILFLLNYYTENTNMR